MYKIKQILRCHTHGMGLKCISKVLCVSRNTVRRYVRTYQDSGISMEKLLSMREEHLRELFYGSKERVQTPTQKEIELQELLPDYSKRMSRRDGPSKAQLYAEYRKRYPQGYCYSSFCVHLRRYRLQSKAIGHVEHKAAEHMYVDFAGDRLSIVNSDTGETNPVEVFVAILPCSHYTYCKAVPSQRKEDFILACEDALRFYGGAPLAIVPDNLKSAVSRPDKIEPTINPDFAAFAEYYGCVVFPARVRHPQDKALVENAVKLIYKNVYVALKDRTFNTLDALNIAISEQMELFNAAKMSSRAESRKALFDEVERDYLRPLPVKRFMMKTRKIVTVMRNSYVTLFRHHYSVPVQYIGKTVELVYDTDSIDIYYGLKWIASHHRDDTPYLYSRKACHNLPGRHGGYEKDMDDIYVRAHNIDNVLLVYLQKVAEEKKYPALAFRSCRGILALEDKYGTERLIVACTMADEAKLYGYTEVLSILKNGQDLDYIVNKDSEIENHEPSTHKNLRGKDYFNTSINETKNLKK